MQRLNEIYHYITKEYPNVFMRITWYVKALFRYIFLPYSDIPYLEVFVTTHCNLKCAKCSNLIPYVSEKKHIPSNQIINSINRLLKYTGYIYRLKLHGGEVFLHPELSKLIKYINNNRRLISVRITTNGLLVPNKSVISALSGSRIIVQISDYDISKDNAEKLIDVFKTNHIKYVYLKDRNWRDMGDFSHRDSNRFSECLVKRCTSMYDEKLYVCSRAAMALNESLIDKSFNIDINSLSSSDFKLHFKKLLSYSNEACTYCDGDTKYAKTISAGEQVK